MVVKSLLSCAHWIGVLLIVLLASFWLSSPATADVTVLNRLDGEPINLVISSSFEMLQTFFSELHIVIAAVLSFAYIFIFIPVCLAYAVHNFMLEFLKIAGDFINIPEVKQVIKMCTM